MSTPDDLDLSLDFVFTEPSRPPSPEATIVVFSRDRKEGTPNNVEDWTEIKIRLVGSHPLWGHYLWNAARAFASYLDSHPALYRDLRVLELGAGGGLPGIVAAKNGARKVVLTDYPDSDLIKNLEHNVLENVMPALSSCVSVSGYIWGQPVERLIQDLPELPRRRKGFDLIIMSDLIFNHSQHDALLRTCNLVLAVTTSEPESASMPNTSLDYYSDSSEKPPSILVFYTHHRPKLASRDMQFFYKAKEQGWNCEEMLTLKFPPMFPDDSGDEEVRSTVHGWRLRR